MNKTEKFIGFLESMKDTSNDALIEAVKEAFVLTEASVRGMPMPDVKSPERKRLSNTSSKPLSPEEQEANATRFKREGSLARQAGGRASGAMSQIVKFAMSSPFDVEKWMNEVLKPAIKQGKLDTDSKYGTDSAKVGFGQRIKNMGKAMLGEGIDPDVGFDIYEVYNKFYPNSSIEELESIKNVAPGIYSSIVNKLKKYVDNTLVGNDGELRSFPFAMDGTVKKSRMEGTEVDYEPEIEEDEDEEEIGGFKSNKDAKRLAKTRRSSLAEGAEVDYNDKDPFEDADVGEDDEDEDEIGGFKSNKFEKRTANTRRAALNENSDTFIAFLESMKDSSNAKIIDSVKAAFNIIA